MRTMWMFLALLVGCNGETGEADDTDGVGAPTAGDDDDDDAVGDDDDDDGGGGAMTPEEFGYAFVERYCAEYEACNTSGEPCFPDTTTGGGTTTDTGTSTCAFDPVAAEACLEGEWTCDARIPGFEFALPPAACMAVCG